MRITFGDTIVVLNATNHSVLLVSFATDGEAIASLWTLTILGSHSLADACNCRRPIPATVPTEL